MRNIVVAGIDTGVGKTIVAAILTEALQADYWKPIQAGDLHATDTDTVRSLVSYPGTVFHQEAYRLQRPMSPHAAAEAEGVTIRQESIVMPKTPRPLVIELAGGLMVPLNHQTLNIHLLKAWQLPVVLVSRYYLGSINHTLLSLEVLRYHQVPLAGIIFNGEENKQSKEVIVKYSGIPLLGSISQEAQWSKELIQQYAVTFRKVI